MVASKKQRAGTSDVKIVNPLTPEQEKIAQEKISRTKDVPSNALSADEINGGSPLELRNLEHEREMKRMELEQELLHATPGQQPGEIQPDQSQPQQAQSQQQDTSAQPQESGIGETVKRAIALTPSLNAIPAIRDAGARGRGDIVAAIPQVLGVTAKIQDFLKTAIFTGKSSKQLTESEEMMNTYMNALSEDLTLYRSGQKPQEEVVKNIKLAEAAINNYESNVVSEGKRNLGYWRDHGAHLEANIITEKDRLNDFKKSVISTGVQNVR